MADSILEEGTLIKLARGLCVPAYLVEVVFVVVELSLPVEHPGESLFLVVVEVALDGRGWLAEPELVVGDIAEVEELVEFLVLLRVLLGGGLLFDLHLLVALVLGGLGLVALDLLFLDCEVFERDLLGRLVERVENTSVSFLAFLGVHRRILEAIL